MTGAAGSIGRVVTAGLAARGHLVTGLDLVPRPDDADLAGSTVHWPTVHLPTVDWLSVDCTDADAVAAAFDGRAFDGRAFDAVVHLAGHPGEAGLPDSLSSHLITTAALLDAMVEHRVSRFVYASSNHAVGRTPRRDRVGVDARPRPDTFYGVAKVAAEAVMSLYADRYGIDAVACRIGSFRERPATMRHLSTWLSHGDCVRMVEAALTAPAPGFAVLYGISANTRAWWDLEPGRALGYEPLDDAEEFAGSIRSDPDDDLDAAHVGGMFATAEFERPALDRVRAVGDGQ
ncbi:NAD(P)-dependent oxidoreductase [Nocardioides panacihumi]|uniref:NAD(P)-dependent oxidoreductase n=1 Tax=Nocardioides panacihumi TaxID=400774 RepID=A0ABN2RVT5_9ACTN